jgi:hypothetical protein
MKTLDVIKSIESLTIVEDMNEQTLTFAGFITPAGEDTCEISVRIHFAFAPSLQSTLSRRGYISTTVMGKVNGINFLYESDLPPAEKEAIGDWVSQVQQEQRKETENAARALIESVVNFSYESK